MAIQKLLQNPELYMKKISEYMEGNPEELLIFAHLTFPQLCSCFITTEYQEIGYRMIQSSIETNNDIFVHHILVSFFDSFPNFSDNFWDLFLKYSITDMSSIYIFIESIRNSFHFLTEKHELIIKEMREKYLILLSKHLYHFYFPLLFNQYSNELSNHFIVHHRIDELNQVFKFIVENPFCSLNSIILDAFESDYYDEDKSKSFFNDLKIKNAYAIISPYEADILFRCFSSIGIIQQHNSNDSVVLKKYRKSIRSVFIKYVYKAFIHGKDSTIASSISLKKSLPSVLFDVQQKIDITYKNDEEKSDIQGIIHQIESISKESNESLFDILFVKKSKEDHINDIDYEYASTLQERIQKLVSLQSKDKKDKIYYEFINKLISKQN